MIYMLSMCQVLVSLESECFIFFFIGPSFTLKNPKVVILLINYAFRHRSSITDAQINKATFGISSEK